MLHANKNNTDNNEAASIKSNGPIHYRYFPSAVHEVYFIYGTNNSSKGSEITILCGPKKVRPAHIFAFIFETS